MKDISAMLLENPIIAAVTNEEGLAKAAASDCKMVFLLYSNICNVGERIAEVKKAGKLPFVHLDLVEGLASKEISLDFIKSMGAYGVISTKPAIIRAASEKGLATVHRFFLIDSNALETCRKFIDPEHTDMIEIMPAPMPKVVKRVVAFSPVPVIAGGLIRDKDDVISVLQVGAMG